MWTFLASGITRWIAAGLVGVVALGGLYVKGRSDGNKLCLATQQAQMDKMETYVKSIREKIEHNVPLDDSDIMRPDTFQRE